MSKSATEVSYQADLKLHRMRDVACGFLARTQALNLERDLVDFLLEIDRQHESQIKDLTQRMESLHEALLQRGLESKL
jgi:hypothetical protein